jgi:hypothetical protein
VCHFVDWYGLITKWNNITALLEFSINSVWIFSSKFCLRESHNLSVWGTFTRNMTLCFKNQSSNSSSNPTIGRAKMFFCFFSWKLIKSITLDSKTTFGIWNKNNSHKFLCVLRPNSSLGFLECLILIILVQQLDL